MMPPISERAEVLKRRITDFMDEHVLPAEKVYAAQLDEAPSRWSIPPVMEELKARAREEGLKPLPAQANMPKASPMSNMQRCAR